MGKIVTLWFDDTEEVVIVKPALVALAGTVTLAGVAAADVLLLESVTTTEPEGHSKG